MMNWNKFLCNYSNLGQLDVRFIAFSSGIPVSYEMLSLKSLAGVTKSTYNSAVDSEC